MLPVNIQIVKTHLLSRRRQTSVAIMSVTFGIGMFILLISFMRGMNQFFQDVMLSVTPDIHIFNDIKTDFTNSIASEYFGSKPGQWIVVHNPKPAQVRKNLKNADQIITDLRSRQDVLAVSPFVSSQVLFNYGPLQVAASIDGVSIEDEIRIFDLSAKMTQGEALSLLYTGNGILMGYKLARKLNLGIGDWVTATTGTGNQMRFKLVGTFQFGISIVDEARAYVTISQMQQMIGKNPDYITDVRIKLKNIDEAKLISPHLENRYGYRVDTWEDVNASLLAGNLIRDVFTGVLTFTMLLVAGIGIYNIMNMIILGKLKDIAILKAQGFKKKDILQIFLFQSLTIGVLGAISGIILGFGLSYGLSKVPWPEDEYIVLKHFPVEFRISYYILGVVYALLTTSLAGLLPALRASRVDPVSILRS